MYEQYKDAISFDCEAYYQWLEGPVIDTQDASAILGAMLGTMKGMCFVMSDVLERLNKLEEQNEMNEKDPKFKPFMGMADPSWMEDEDDIAALVEESRRMVSTVKEMMVKIDELDRILRERLPKET